MTVTRVLAAIVLLLSVAATATAQPNVGDTVTLKATHHAGVPLHTKAGGGPDFERVPDGASAKVLALEGNGHWLKLKVDADGREGWVVEKYVVAGQEPVPPPGDDRAADVWASAAKCSEALQAGARMTMPDNSQDALRIATWNIRWFSKGCSTNEQCPENATDLDWLACAIAWMDLDVLAVQEILTTQPSKTAMQTLLTKLNQLTGGSWKSDLQSCGSGDHQKVGFLWNSSKVTGSNAKDVWELNAVSTGSSNACMNKLRPGRYQRFKSKTTGGVDFHAVSVHFDSGTANHDYQNRRTATERITEIVVDTSANPDLDLIVLGDFNTMGRQEGAAVSAEEEIDIFDGELSPGFHRITGPACSEYFQRKGGLLDHVVVAEAMQEIATSATLGGYCAVKQCGEIPSPGPMPAAYEALSDHCPIVVTIADADQD